MVYRYELWFLCAEQFFTTSIPVSSQKCIIMALKYKNIGCSVNENKIV